MTKKSDKQRVKKAESNLGVVEGALTRTEIWFEKNSKWLIIGVSIVVIIVLAVFGYHRFIRLPKIEQAQKEMFKAEQYFAKDANTSLGMAERKLYQDSSYRKALNGDGNYAGFLEIVETYGSTKPGKLAAYYAGICYMNLGEFENAITYLKKFKSDDEFLAPMAEGLIGDANLELGKVSEAIIHYKKAADMRKNDVTTPTFLLKVGMCNEMDNHLQAALDEYEKIRREYPNSNEAREVEKYIARIKAKM